jgi:hypothetical protein
VVLVVLHNTPKSLTTSERAKQLVISQELFGTPHSTDKDIMDTTTPGPSLIGPTMKKNTPADVRARMALEVPLPARCQHHWKPRRALQRTHQS